MAKIKIPPVLRPSVGGEKEVQAGGDDVGAVLRALASEHPATQSQLFGADGQLNRYVNVYLNDEDVRVLNGPGHVGRRVRHARHPAGDGRRRGLDRRRTGYLRGRGDFYAAAAQHRRDPRRGDQGRHAPLAAADQGIVLFVVPARGDLRAADRRRSTRRSSSSRRRTRTTTFERGRTPARRSAASAVTGVLLDADVPGASTSRASRSSATRGWARTPDVGRSLRFGAAARAGGRSWLAIVWAVVDRARRSSR